MRTAILIVVSGLVLSSALAAAEPDDEAAITALLPRAEQGDLDSQAALGFLYSDGKGGVRDFAEAAKWARKAAERGNRAAQRKLGFLYVAGLGVGQDFAAAAQWYRKAAEQGDTEAQFQLGLLTGMGRGIAQDAVAAYAWLDLAAGQGHEDAAASRAVVAGTMTAEQLAAAQNLVQQWKAAGK